MALRPRVLTVLASATASLALAAGALAADSVTYQADPAHDGFVDEAIAPPLGVRWAHRFGERVSYPVVAGGRVFVTTAASGGAYGTTLHALDAGTGAELWSAPLPGTYYWSALAYDAGRIFSVTYDGRVAARAADTGAEQWSVQLGQSSFSSPPTVAGGMLYVGGAGSGGTLYALDEATGAVRWSQSVANGDNSAPAYDGTRVFVSYAGPQAYGFQAASGAPAWHYDSGIEGGGGKTAVVHGGRMYVRETPTSLVLDAGNGAKLGEFPYGTAPAFAGDLGVFNEGGTLRGRDASSLAVRWSLAPPSDGFVSAPFIAGAHVYAAGGGRLYAIDRATGAVAWDCAVGDIPGPDEQNVSQPLTGFGAGGGMLFVPTTDSLIALAHTSAGSCPSAGAPAAGSGPSVAGTAGSGVAYGGGSRLPRKIGSTAISLVRSPDNRVAGRLGFGITCARTPYLNMVLRVRGLAAADGSFRASGSLRVTRRGRVTAALTGRFDGAAASGTVRIAGRRIRCGGWKHPFVARTASAPRGTAAMPAPRAVLAGVTGQSAAGTPLSVLLGVSGGGRQVTALWQVVMRCGPRATAPVVNFSPPVTIRPDGTFTRRETFTIRYRDRSRERYRVTVTGRFLSDGAVGTVRARMTTRKRGHRYYPCDSGAQSWAASA